ncbi:MAG TPA: RNA methyltransferase [Syntrophorhabdaceae bacterium]|nr:RNA methyltransferase [Syntrophorhabdaceae bacterium]
MPLLTNKNTILEVMKEHPGQVKKLWVEQGFERVLNECIIEAKARGIQFRVLARDAFLNRFKGLKSHICLERDEFSYKDPDELLNDLKGRKNPFLCAFDGVQDPQNLGNIVRSSACLDLEALIIPKDRACTVTDTVIEIARGALEHVAIARVTNLARYLDTLKKQGFFCYGLDEHGESSIWEIDLTGPVCLVLGGEEGLRRLTRDTCDALIKIPTNPSFPSLNVATCFALSAYEVKRQRETVRSR